MIKKYFSYYIYHQKENENKTPFLPGGLSWNKNRLWDISWGWSTLGRFFRDLEVSLQLSRWSAAAITRLPPRLPATLSSSHSRALCFSRFFFSRFLSAAIQHTLQWLRSPSRFEQCLLNSMGALVCLQLVHCFILL